MRKTIPMARSVFGENHEFTLKMRKNYADALWEDDSATLDNLREAMTTLEDTERIARRVFGGAHPLVKRIGQSLEVVRCLKNSQAFRARETPPPLQA